MAYAKAQTVSVVWALLLLLLAPSAYAQITQGHEDPSDFGHLRQGSVPGGALACGPVAAVNSFVFLQNKYPRFYRSPLINLNVSPNTLESEEIALAEKLCVSMHCQAQGGTDADGFLKAKTDYFASLGNSLTSIQERTNPSVEWLAEELNHGEDVEILMMTATSQVGHYVTLYDIYWDPTGDEGLMQWIDPATGGDGLANLHGSSSTDYRFDYFEPLEPVSMPDARIVWAVSESPVPEPGSALLLLTGIVGLLAVRWRRRRGPPARG